MGEFQSTGVGKPAKLPVITEESPHIIAVGLGFHQGMFALAETQGGVQAGSSLKAGSVPGPLWSTLQHLASSGHMVGSA